MKNLILISFLLACSILQAQNLKLTADSKTDFLLGKKATILTSQNKQRLEFLSKNKINLILEGYNVNYQVEIVSDSLLKWEFGIPSVNEIVGKDKELIFDDGTIKQESVLLNFYSKSPELINYNTNVIYNDVPEPQNLTFTFNNAAYVDKIEFIDNKIQIDGTNQHIITSSSYGFNVNSVNNTISINILPNDCEIFDVIFYYTGQESYQTEATDTVKLRISKERKYLHQRFKIITGSSLYIDDFASHKYKPKIIFDFENIGTIGRRYEIELENPDIELKTLSGESEFDMPNSKKVEIEIANIKASGTYGVKITSNNGETFSSSLNILPKPTISEFKISSSPNNVIEKDINKIYSLFIKGEGLHKMNEIQIELVNINTSQTYSFIKQPNIEENSINTQIKFDLTSNDDIPVGEYYLRLSRELKEKQISYKRVYPVYNPLISIQYPKMIIANQVKQVSLFEAKYFKGDSLSKKYSSLKGTILEKNSPLTLKISPAVENIKYGPQFIKVSANYYKSDGNVIRLNITEGGNDYVTVFNKPIFIDFKEEFTINEFNVNEKIEVTLAHSPEKYGSNKKSPVNKVIYHRGSTFADKIGITLTLPPYLATFRNVKRKTISENENGGKEVTYDGDKELEFQSLAINAGLGFKFRTKNKYYEPSKFALGLYLMGLDFANASSVEEQKADEDNYNFIGRGSFNLMFLGEYSFLNLDNPNTRIPVYFGTIYIFDPIDGGSKFAPVFGFGIDIKLFGSN